MDEQCSERSRFAEREAVRLGRERHRRFAWTMVYPTRLRRQGALEYFFPRFFHAKTSDKDVASLEWGSRFFIFLKKFHSDPRGNCSVSSSGDTVVIQRCLRPLTEQQQLNEELSGIGSDSRPRTYSASHVLQSSPRGTTRQCEQLHNT